MAKSLKTPDEQEFEDYQDYQDYTAYQAKSQKTPPRDVPEFSPMKTLAQATMDTLSQPMMGNRDAQERVGPILEGDAPLALPGQAVPKLLAAGNKLASSPLLRTAASTAVGGAEGFLGGPSDQTLGERWENAKSGAARGALMGAGSEALAGGASLLAKGARKVATGAAFKAMGPDFRAARQNMAKGKVNEIGGTLLDEGVIEGYAPRGAEALGKRLGEFKDRAKTSLNEVLSQLDEAGSKITAGGGKGGVSRSSIAKSLRDDLINPNLDLPGIKAKNKTVNRLIDDFENGGDDLLGILKAEGKKKSVGKEIKWDRLPGTDVPVEEQVSRALYTKLKQGVEQGAEAFEKLGHGPGKAKFVKAKDTYGNLKEAQNIAEKRAARDGANRMISPSDYATGLAGGVVGALSGDDLESRATNAAIGMSLGGLNKLGRKYGNQPLAVGANNLSRGAARVAGWADLARRNPAVVQPLMGILSRGLSAAPEITEKQLNLFRDNPKLLENVEDPKLRAEIERRLNRSPGGDSRSPLLPR